LFSPYVHLLWIDGRPHSITIRPWASTAARWRFGAAAEKEAATWRATDAQVLKEAERLIAAWNERQALRAPRRAGLHSLRSPSSSRLMERLAAGVRFAP